MAVWDVAVIGAGILGSSAAWQLAQRGLRVVILDRGSRPGFGSTARSTAIIRHRYSRLEAMALAQEGQRTWLHWPELVPADESGARARLVRSGVLFLLPAGESGTARLAADMAGLGIAVERLEAGAVADRFPALAIAPSEALEGLYEPEGGYVDDPVRATQDVARAAEALGATFRPWTDVVEVMTAWEGGRPRVTGIRTDGGDTLAARAVVNCAGPHSGAVNLMARTPLALATAPLRQHVLDATAPGLAGMPGPHPVVADLLGGFYARLDAERFRVGCVWPQDERDWLAHADMDPGEADERVIAEKLEALRRRIPGLELHNLRGLTGVYDVTVQDWYPIVDRTDTDGFFVAIGSSGAWFKAGPVIGQLVAELVAAWLEGGDTDRDPLEVTLPFTGHRFPLSLFSRRRPPVELEYGGGVLG